jgi:hypothetical protein
VGRLPVPGTHRSEHHARLVALPRVSYPRGNVSQRSLIARTGRALLILPPACAVVCIALASGTASGPDVGCGAIVLSCRFGDEPADSLIRKVELGPNALASTEIITTDPQTGLAVRQRYRWAADLRAVFIESSLTNPGKTAVNAQPVGLGRWDFRVADAQDGLRYRDLTYRNDTWYGSTYWTGPDWTRVGKDWHHPGENTPSVRRFAAPRAGRVKITGRVYKADTNNGGGDGVRLSIRHGPRTVWQAEINGNDAKGVEPNVTLDVLQGDAVRFVVHKRGHIFCDTTHWDPAVAYMDTGSGTERFQASAGFSTSNQGQGGWSYEMEVDPQSSQSLPCIYDYGTDSDLRERTPVAGTPIVMTDRDSLGLFVIADGADKSGVYLAVGPTSPWRFAATLGNDGCFRVGLDATHVAGGSALKPGESVPLPQVVLGAYRGGWLKGVSMLERLLDAEARGRGIDGLRRRLSSAFVRVTSPLGADLKPLPNVAGDIALPELDLWTMVQADWRGQDRIAETADACKVATARHIEKARNLLEDLQKVADRPSSSENFLSAESHLLDQLASRASRPAPTLDGQRSLYLGVRWLKRRIALSNPLLGFDKLLFCKRVPTAYSHLVMQYFGWRARPGGGLFILEKPGYSLAAHDILSGGLADGNVLEPRLSYDGRRVVFSFVRCPGGERDFNTLDNNVDEGFYHIYEANIDGTGLRQLTRGPYDDVMPTYLPDGGIAFCSTRRRGYARCFGGQFSRRWHVYTLHRMDGDGQNIRTLSFHDTNEWFPAVSNTGLILYSRWDYIDRDAVTHQNLWATRPDGTNPIAVWGNATPTPHCSFQIQPIPGSSKIVFTASAHHSIAGGSIAVVDPTVANNGQQAITRITPEVPFPEAEGNNIREYYEAPWPLSEKYFLVGYSPKPLVWEPGANDRDALGIYLLDAAGNRELIYRDSDIGSTNPCPLLARVKPPVLQSALAADAPPAGEMTLMDVYQGLGGVPRGNIKALRIIQILPKTTHVAGSPPVGIAGEENARAVLGTVPVEYDGSARFIVPARKPILFQALDGDGFAVQTMRSVTYVQPGERVSCAGCHESRMSAPVPKSAVAAARPPSRIDPGPFDGQPFSFVRMVQPVLDKHCVSCHGSDKPVKGIDLTGRPDRGFTKSYWSLCGDKDFWGAGTNPKNAAEALVPRFGARNQIQVTPPGGQYGALGSRLIKMLRKGHEDVRLSADDMRRLAVWIDCNAIFFGVSKLEDQARQLRGEALAMPDVQ